MDQATILKLVQLGMSGALAAADLFTKALEAANNGDLAAAEAYLAQGRTHFDQAVADWQAAGGNTTAP